jgi:hypothetical protein
MDVKRPKGSYSDQTPSMERVRRSRNNASRRKHVGINFVSFVYKIYFVKEVDVCG